MPGVVERTDLFAVFDACRLERFPQQHGVPVGRRASSPSPGGRTHSRCPPCTASPGSGGRARRLGRREGDKRSPSSLLDSTTRSVASVRLTSRHRRPCSSCRRRPVRCRVRNTALARSSVNAAAARRTSSGSRIRHRSGFAFGLSTPITGFAWMSSSATALRGCRAGGSPPRSRSSANASPEPPDVPGDVARPDRTESGRAEVVDQVDKAMLVRRAVFGFQPRTLLLEPCLGVVAEGERVRLRQPFLSTLTSRSRSSASAVLRVTPSRSAPTVSITCFPVASAYLIRQTRPRLPCVRDTARASRHRFPFLRYGPRTRRYRRRPRGRAHLDNTTRGSEPISRMT